MNVHRRALIAGNWKMNAGGRDGIDLAQGVAKGTKECTKVDILIIPPYTALAAVAHTLAEARSKAQLGAQNLHEAEMGAFTGEISGSMLRDAGATAVLVGHSERRHVFGESDERVAAKLERALATDLLPVVCFGETEAQRHDDQTEATLRRQFDAVAQLILDAPAGKVVLAYEPVWAIGTGKVAEPKDAGQAHAWLRSWLQQASEAHALETRILYGGSVKPESADGLLEEAEVDGLLVGGASLDAAAFSRITMAAELIARRAETPGPS